MKQEQPGKLFEVVWRNGKPLSNRENITVSVCRKKPLEKKVQKMSDLCQIFLIIQKTINISLLTVNDRFRIGYF